MAPHFPVDDRLTSCRGPSTCRVIPHIIHACTNSDPSARALALERTDPLVSAMPILQVPSGDESSPQEKGSPRKGLRWVLGPGPTHHSPCNPESETNARVPIPTSPIWSWGIVGIGLQKHGQDDQTTSHEDGRVLRVVFGVVSDGWEAGGWQGGPTMFGGSFRRSGEGEGSPAARRDGSVKGVMGVVEDDGDIEEKGMKEGAIRGSCEKRRGGELRDVLCPSD